MFANVLVSVLAGTGYVIYKVKWSDIGLIWVYDIVCLLIIDFIKVSMRYWQLPLMSAGAASGVLGYPDLPEQAQNRESLRSGLTSMGQSRGSVRSVMRSHVASVASGHLAASQRSWEPKSASMLPFPYNVRANASRNVQSF